MTKVYRITENGKKKDYRSPEDSLTLSQLERFEVLDYLNSCGSATVEQIVGFTRLPGDEIAPILSDFEKSGLVEAAVS